MSSLSHRNEGDYIINKMEGLFNVRTQVHVVGLFCPFVALTGEVERGRGGGGHLLWILIYCGLTLRHLLPGYASVSRAILYPFCVLLGIHPSQAFWQYAPPPALHSGIKTTPLKHTFHKGSRKIASHTQNRRTTSASQRLRLLRRLLCYGRRLSSKLLLFCNHPSKFPLQHRWLHSLPFRLRRHPVGNSPPRCSSDGSVLCCRHFHGLDHHLHRHGHEDSPS